MTRFFAALVMPAICTAAVAYFGYYAIWGTRGLVALSDTQARLEVRQEQLAGLDPDMVEEVAHSQLLEGAPGQVAIPRAPAH